MRSRFGNCRQTTQMPKSHELPKAMNRQVSKAAVAMVLCGCLSAWAQERYVLESGQWSKQATIDPATAHGQLQLVRRALAQDNPDQALEEINLWIEKHTEHPRMAEAWLLRGDCQIAGGQYYKALYDYEHVIRQYPASDAFTTALEREYRIAKIFASGVKRKWLGMRLLSAAGEAEEIFIRIQERIPGSETGEMASLALGNFYFDRAQMTSAAEAYELFLDNYPESQYVERAMLGLIQASLATFKGPRFDTTGLIEAAQRIKTFQEQFPAAAERIGTDALLVRINESLALTMLFTAQWYEKRHQQHESIYVYQQVLKNYSQTAAAAEAMTSLSRLSAPIVAGTDTLMSPDAIDSRRREDRP